jgi:mannosyltransferase
VNRNKGSGVVIAWVAAISIAISFFLIRSQSIRLDEAQSIWTSSKSVKELLQLTANDVHVPLYGLLLHLVMQVFGNDILVARMLSLFFYVLTIPFLYRLARESSDRWVAVLTVTLFSFSPFIVWYSGEARMYTLFSLSVSVNQLFFLRLIRSRGKHGKLGYFIGTLTGLYTHYFFIFVLVSQALYVFFHNLTKENGVGLSKKFKLTWLGISGLSFSLFVPWVYFMVKSGLGEGMRPLLTTPSSYSIVQTFTNFLFGFQEEEVQNLFISLWPLSTALLFLIFTEKNKKKTRNIDYFFLVTFLPVLLVFVISYIQPIFLSRYLILVTPTLFFLLAWTIGNYQRRVSLILAELVIALMVGMTMYQYFSNKTPVKESYRELSSYLSESVEPSDVVAISAPFTIYPIEYNYEGQARLVTIPEWNRYLENSNIPEYKDDDLAGMMSKFREKYKKMYLVLSYDQGYEKDIRNYLDHNFEITEQREFPTDISLVVYKLKY